MSVLYWPDSLPQRILLQGSIGTPDGRLKIQMDAGPSKFRRRSSAAVRPVQAHMVVRPDNYARFERFWFEDTLGGVRPFLIRDQVKDGEALLRTGCELLLSGDEPLLVTSWWLVQFDGAPSASSLRSRGYEVSFQLSILP